MNLMAEDSVSTVERKLPSGDPQAPGSVEPFRLPRQLNRRALSSGNGNVRSWLRARQTWFMIAVPALISFALGYRRADNTRLWLDEFATWSVARRSWSEIFELLGNLDAVHTVYYLFMHGWLSIFGESELSLRMPSLLAMAAATGLVVALGQRMFTPMAGLCAGVLFALTPTVTNTAQYARGYSLSIMFAAGSTLALIAALDTPSTWRWLTYGILVVFMGALHLIAILLVAAHGFLAVQRAMAGKRSLLLWWFAATSCALAAISPLIYVGLSQKSQILARQVPQLSQFPAFLGDLFGTVLIAGVFIGLAVAAQHHARHWLGLLLVWAVFPMAVVFAVSYVLTSRYHAQSYWEARYVLFCLPAVALLAGLALSKIQRWVVTVALVAGIAISIQPFVDLRGEDGSGKLQAAQFLQSNVRVGDVAVYNAGELWGPRDFVRYYVNPRMQPRDILAAESVEASGRLTPQERAEPDRYLRNEQRIWVIRHGNYQLDPVMYLGGPEVFLRQNFHPVLSREFDGITVALLVPNS